MGAMMAPKPGSTFQNNQIPAQGGKTPIVSGPNVDPVRSPPQSPYRPIGSQGGKGGGNIDPVRPRPFENVPGPQIPAQGGKTTPPTNPNIPAQGGKTTPVYPTVGSRLPDGTVVTQQGIDQAKALNAAKGQGQVQPAIPQPAPIMSAPVVAPAPVITPTPITPAPTGLAGLSQIRQKVKPRR